ncbi:MAG TPA: hypothetical protein VF555_05385 [Variovorax sp.]
MNEIDSFGKLISQRLNAIGFKSPGQSTIQYICRTIQTASLITEEGRFVQGSITLSNPKDPHPFPSKRRADYPSFTKLENVIPFRPETFGKLARAVDQWSGSLAVWGRSKKTMVIWGIVDQLVGTNASLNREGSGFHNPGQLTISIDRPGDITAYHGGIYLGSLRAQKIIKSESEPFGSPVIFDKIIPGYMPVAEAIEAVVSKVVESENPPAQIAALLCEEWSSALARLCIGLRRFGTGGAFIITPKAVVSLLKVGQPFIYKRLASSLALGVLDATYAHAMRENRRRFENSVPYGFVIEQSFADIDLIDRQDELTGAIKLVTSLATLDGAVLLDIDLTVKGFGVKINAPAVPVIVYDGRKYKKSGGTASVIDQSRFGMRHTSMINYCAADPSAIGLVVSQDGHVRLVSNQDGDIILWDQIQLLNHRNFTTGAVGANVLHRKNAAKLAKKFKSLGYSVMPKTFEDLMVGILN